MILRFHNEIFPCMLLQDILFPNPTALRKAKIAYNFGVSECNRVKA